MKFPKSPEQEGHVLKSLVLVKNLPHLLGGWANVLNNLMKVEIFPEALGQMTKVLLLPGQPGNNPGLLGQMVNFQETLGKMMKFLDTTA